MEIDVSFTSWPLYPRKIALYPRLSLEVRLGRRNCISSHCVGGRNVFPRLEIEQRLVSNVVCILVRVPSAIWRLRTNTETTQIELTS